MITKEMFICLSALQPREARALLVGTSPLRFSARAAREQQTSGAAPFMRIRARLIRKFKKSLVHVFNFAKHETLRKLHRYMYSHRPLVGADAPDAPTHPDAARIAFNPDELRQDLIRMLQIEMTNSIELSVNDVLGALGYAGDPWRLPAQETLDLIAMRQNLIRGVPDEIFSQIQRQISEGLSKGESIAELASRIASAFDDIIDTRAQLIAETETSAAYGFASQAAAQHAGVQYKQWVHSSVPKEPRPDHLAIDGLIVPIGEAYPVGDPELMFPHDPDGSAGDVINCYCISVPATEEEFRAQ